MHYALQIIKLSIMHYALHGILRMVVRLLFNLVINSEY